MQDVLIAMAKAGGFLMAVAVFIVLISITTVKRGERSMEGHATPAGGGHATAVAAEPARRETRDGTVLEILVLSIVAFTLTMGLLIGVSVLQHMN